MTATRNMLSWFFMVATFVCVFLLGGYVTHLRNLANEAQYQRDEQLRRAELIVVSSAHAIVMCGHDGRITVCNPAAEKMFGYSHQELHGEEIRKLLPEELRSKHDAVFVSASARARKLTEQRFALYRDHVPGVAKHKDGRLIPVLLSIRVIKYGSKIEFIAVIAPREPGYNPVEKSGGLILPNLTERRDSERKN